MKNVILDTNMGIIEIELDEIKAPISVGNFLEYVKLGFYNNTIFHRVINDFMIQGGGFDEEMQQKHSTKDPIVNEAHNGLKNVAYSIAMARTMMPHSATCQFFINVKNNDFLNYQSSDAKEYGYAVFGKVIAGTDIVDKIKIVATTNKNGHDDVPINNVVIRTAYINEQIS